MSEAIKGPTGGIQPLTKLIGIPDSPEGRQKGYPGHDSMTVAAGAAFRSGGGGHVVSLGTVGGIHAYVEVPKTIFEYYPPWMKQHNLKMDLERWKKLAVDHQAELERPENRKVKLFFDLVKLLGALAAGNPAVLPLITEQFTLVSRDGILVAKLIDSQNADRAPRYSQNQHQERFKQKIAEAIVDGLFFPVTIARSLGRLGGRALDVLGNGLEAVWHFSLPVVNPIGRALRAVIRGALGVQHSILRFIQKHTQPTRAREDLLRLVRGIFNTASNLTGLLGLKALGRAVKNALAGTAKAFGEAIGRLFRPLFTWLENKSTQIIDALLNFLSRFR